jgi:hypothetical protein
MSRVCTLAHGALRRYFGAKSKDFMEKSPNIENKMCNHFIFTSILNPCESSYDKCHRLSFNMSQTWFVCSIGHFRVKHRRFFMKIFETVTSK